MRSVLGRSASPGSSVASPPILIGFLVRPCTSISIPSFQLTRYLFLQTRGRGGVRIQQRPTSSRLTFLVTPSSPPPWPSCRASLSSASQSQTKLERSTHDENSKEQVLDKPTTTTLDKYESIAQEILEDIKTKWQSEEMTNKDRATRLRNLLNRHSTTNEELSKIFALISNKSGLVKTGRLLNLLFTQDTFGLTSLATLTVGIVDQRLNVQAPPITGLSPSVASQWKDPIKLERVRMLGQLVEGTVEHWTVDEIAKYFRILPKVPHTPSPSSSSSPSSSTTTTSTSTSTPTSTPTSTSTSTPTSTSPSISMSSTLFSYSSKLQPYRWEGWELGSLIGRVSPARSKKRDIEFFMDLTVRVMTSVESGGGLSGQKLITARKPFAAEAPLLESNLIFHSSNPLISIQVHDQSKNKNKNVNESKESNINNNNNSNNSINENINNKMELSSLETLRHDLRAAAEVTAAMLTEQNQWWNNDDYAIAISCLINAFAEYASQRPGGEALNNRKTYLTFMADMLVHSAVGITPTTSLCHYMINQVTSGMDELEEEELISNIERRLKPYSFTRRLWRKMWKLQPPPIEN